MKPIIIAILLFMTVGLLTSCSHSSYPAKSLPPGQAKKVTGSKSAKAYAPGQQKKRH